jgi:hypothetical protein
MDKPKSEAKTGNPGGRQKSEKTLRLLAREHTEEAVRTLVEVMQNVEASPDARVAAATALLDRGHGKPLAQPEIGKPGAFSELTNDELDAVITRMEAELAALKQGAKSLNQ